MQKAALFIFFEINRKPNPNSTGNLLAHIIKKGLWWTSGKFLSTAQSYLQVPTLIIVGEWLQDNDQQHARKDRVGLFPQH